MSNFWDVKIMEGLKCVWEKRMPAHRLEESNIKTLIACLLSKHYSFDEISNACMNKRCGGPLRVPMFDITKHTNLLKKTTYYMSNGNPYVIVSFERE